MVRIDAVLALVVVVTYNAESGGQHYLCIATHIQCLANFIKVLSGQKGFEWILFNFSPTKLL